MRDAVIVDVVRTPGGRRNSQLRDWHPASLSALTLKALAQRNELDPSIVEDVILGCVMQVGNQAMNVARNAVLAAGWPESVPGTTIDRQCGSSQQAMHFAAQGVMAGVYDVVVAAGVESMTRVPMFSSFDDERSPWSPEELARYVATGLPPQGIAAEMIAEKYGLGRAELDEFSAASHDRALAATKAGRFSSEIIPVPVDLGDGIELLVRDEGIRPGTTVETLSALRPVFVEGGVVTAGNSSQICDGASAALIMSSERAEELGLRARARFRGFALAGVDPVLMLEGPIPATQKVLERCGLELDDVDVIEINEAFASVVLAWQRATGADLGRVNPNGGAIALGHPLGSSGTRIMATMVNELERTGGRFGLQVMCEGGGMANATVVERLGA